MMFVWPIYHLVDKDTWSCPTLGLASVLMSRPISPELVLSPDFWISNIPRYFYFAWYCNWLFYDSAQPYLEALHSDQKAMNAKRSFLKLPQYRRGHYTRPNWWIVGILKRLGLCSVQDRCSTVYSCGFQ